MSYGNEGTGGIRRSIRAEVAREYPPIKIYRQVRTPYEMQKAEAGKFFYGNPQIPTRNVGLLVTAIALYYFTRD
jgi:hypothetical protein